MSLDLHQQIAYFLKINWPVKIEKQIPKGKKMWVFDKSGKKVLPENKTSL